MQVQPRFNGIFSVHSTLRPIEDVSRNHRKYSFWIVSVSLGCTIVFNASSPVIEISTIHRLGCFITHLFSLILIQKLTLHRYLPSFKKKIYVDYEIILIDNKTPKSQKNDKGEKCFSKQHSLLNITLYRAHNVSVFRLVVSSLSLSKCLSSSPSLCTALLQSGYTSCARAALSTR